MVRARRLGRSAGVALVLLLALSFVSVTAMNPRPTQAQSTAVTGVGPWTEEDNYGSQTTSGGITILGESCVYYGGYFYCVGGQNLQKLSDSDISGVFYTPVSATGIIGGWAETTDYGSTNSTTGTQGLGVEWPSCVEYSGDVYCVGGATNSGTTSAVFYAQLTASGVGPWKETTDYGAAAGSEGSGGVTGFQHSCVTNGGYIYCVGDGYGTSKVFYAQLTADGVGPWAETTDYGATSGSEGTGGVDIGSTDCVATNATIFCVGGTVSGNAVSDVFYAPLSASGVGRWTETTDYGASSGNQGSGGTPIYGTSCVVYQSTLICIAGNTAGNTPSNDVYYAQDPVDLVWTPTGPSPFEGYWAFCDVPDSPHVVCGAGGSNYVTSGTIQTPGTATTSSTLATSTTTPTVPPSTTVAESTTTTTATLPPTTTIQETTTTTVASSLETTTPILTSSPSSFPLIPVVALAIVAIVVLGLFLWRRGSTREKPVQPPPPPPPPPPPVSPLPQSTAPPSEDVPCCGPDVTDNVLGAMLVMMNDFFHWGADKQSKELGYLTRISLTPGDSEPNFNNAWDIPELSPAQTREGAAPGKNYVSTLKPYEGNCMKPKVPCYPSVIFLGNCHNPQVVNYIQWGVLARLNDWKNGGSAAGYNESTFHSYHNERSGVGMLVIARNSQLIDAGMTDKLDYSPLDPNFPDQIAMANVGWHLADDYIARKNSNGLPYKLSQVNVIALQAVLEIYENKGRPMANCQNCKGCGKYHSVGPQNLAFAYTFGDETPDTYTQLKDL